MKINGLALARALLVASVLEGSVQATALAQPQIEGLPDEASRQGMVITVDVSKNRGYLFRDGQLLAGGRAATGTEKVLIHGDDVWLFHTPRGHLKVLEKIENPVWTKPDWAFVEAGKPIPPPDSPLRQATGVMGRYALALGEGIFIHGTDDPSSLGKKASHGCIRLPARMLETIWKLVKVGTDVYIFDSTPPPPVASGSAPEYHSDFDYRQH